MPIHPYDWVNPIAHQMGIKMKSINDPNEANRWLEYTQIPIFQCPTYAGVVATQFGSVGSGIVQAPSYNTAACFLLTTGSPTAGTTDVTRISTGPNWPKYPQGYAPQITKIGSTSDKIFMADGGKFTNGYNANVYLPDYNIGLNSGSGWASNGNGIYCSFADFGPWIKATSSYDRGYLKANGGVSTGMDNRLYAWRHGNPKNGSYRMNAVFFDGHAATLAENDSTDPKYWVPKGASLVTTNMWPDVVTAHSVQTGQIVP
jgi:hypothetical protein